MKNLIITFNNRKNKSINKKKVKIIKLPFYNKLLKFKIYFQLNESNRKKNKKIYYLVIFHNNRLNGSHQFKQNLKLINKK